MNITGGSLTSSGANITFSNAGLLTVSAQLTGTAGLTKTGAGTLVLAGNNTYSGTTSITQGVIVLANSNAVQNSTVSVNVDNGLQFSPFIGTFNVGSLSGRALPLTDTGSGAITLVTGRNNADTTYSGNISGAGTLVHGGSGVMVLSGNNTFSGGLVLAEDATGGGISVSSPVNLGTGPITFTGNNTLFLSPSMTATNSIAINTGFAGAIDTQLGYTVILTGVVSGGGTLNKVDAGTLVLVNPGNSISGGMTISQGTLALGNFNAAASSTVGINTDYGLQFSPFIGTFNIGGLSGGNAETLADSNGTPVNLVVGGNNQNTTCSGSIGGPGTLTKAGTGSLDLDGTNTWTGGLVDDPGVVQFAETCSMPPIGTVTVAKGAIVAVNAGGNGEFTYDAASGTRGTISGLLAGVGGQGAPVVWQSGAILGIDSTNAPGGAATYNGNITNTSNGPLGLATLGSGTLTLTGINTYTGGTDVLANSTLIISSPDAIDATNVGTDLAVGSISLLAEFDTDFSPILPASGARLHTRARTLGAGTPCSRIAVCRGGGGSLAKYARRQGIIVANGNFNLPKTCRVRLSSTRAINDPPDVAGLRHARRHPTVVDLWTTPTTRWAGTPPALTRCRTASRRSTLRMKRVPARPTAFPPRAGQGRGRELAGQAKANVKVAPNAHDRRRCPDRIGGRYRVEACLGEGAFGRVYRCRDEVLKRTVPSKCPIANG